MRLNIYILNLGCTAKNVNLSCSVCNLKEMSIFILLNKPLKLIKFYLKLE